MARTNGKVTDTVKRLLALEDGQRDLIHAVGLVRDETSAVPGSNRRPAA